jgi:general L-amino acid transport system permease protein
MAIEDVGLRRFEHATPSVPLFYNPRFRAFAFQIVLAVAIVVCIIWFVDNTIDNLRRAHIASGFEFLQNRSGFDISQSLIPYSTESTYGRALVVGLLNTLLVAAIGIVLASIIGFLLGIARLSNNWLIAKLATVYVEVFRNVPVLLQILLWYKGVLSLLPGPRQGYSLPFSSNLSNRGLIIPRPVAGANFGLTVIALLVAIIIVLLLADWARHRQMATGRRFPTFRTGLGVIVGLPLIVFLASGSPLTFEAPQLKGFNFIGGLNLKPELMSLVLALSIYTATYIAEIVRAGIVAVSYGQTEAAYSLGLRPGVTLRLIDIPQALRVIIPPLTSQYLNLTKNSSLAVAIGYPDLVSVFSGTVLNQTGQAIEVIFITMLIYLAISLTTAFFMNWFNRRVALVER